MRSLMNCTAQNILLGQSNWEEWDVWTYRM
jgi:hypothetical protein